MAGVVGKYTLERELGSGATSVTWLASEPSGAKVALKVLVFPQGTTPWSKDGQERVERFQREGRALQGISHPSIPRVFELGCDQGRHYLAMQYCPGATLREVLELQGPLTKDAAIRAAGQLLSALDAAHRSGICHRDVKPENIIKSSDADRMMLIDFGIARGYGASNLTKAGLAVGTPAYMPPEQIRGETIDGRVDLFAVGVLLHELLTGRRPFGGAGDLALAAVILNEEPRLSPSVPPDLIWIIQRALAKEADQRFQTAAEMALALHSPLQAAPASRPAGLKRPWRLADSFLPTVPPTSLHGQPDGPTPSPPESGGQRAARPIAAGSPAIPAAPPPTAPPAATPHAPALPNPAIFVVAEASGVRHNLATQPPPGARRALMQAANSSPQPVLVGQSDHPIPTVRRADRKLLAAAAILTPIAALLMLMVLFLSRDWSVRREVAVVTPASVSIEPSHVPPSSSAPADAGPHQPEVEQPARTGARPEEVQASTAPAAQPDPLGPLGSADEERDSTPTPPRDERSPAPRLGSFQGDYASTGLPPQNWSYNSGPRLNPGDTVLRVEPATPALPPPIQSQPAPRIGAGSQPYRSTDSSGPRSRGDSSSGSYANPATRSFGRDYRGRMRGSGFGAPSFRPSEGSPSGFGAHREPPPTGEPTQPRRRQPFVGTPNQTIETMQPAMALEFGIKATSPIPNPRIHQFWYRTITADEARARGYLYSEPIPDPEVYGPPPVSIRKIGMPDWYDPGRTRG
jgi:serine/threonine protein kinase